MRSVGRGQNNGPHVAAGTAISRTGSESVRPHLFVGQPVRAHDADGRKFLVQTLDILKSREFQIHDRGVSAVLRYRALQIFEVTRNVDHTKMDVQRLDQQLRALAVALEDNNAEGLHGGHDFHPHLSSLFEGLGRKVVAFSPGIDACGTSRKSNETT